MVKYVDECEGFVVSAEQSVYIYSKKSAKDKLDPIFPKQRSNGIKVVLATRDVADLVLVSLAHNFAQ